MGYQRDLVASRLAPLESAGRQEGGVRGGGGHPWRPQVVSAGLRCARQGHNGFETQAYAPTAAQVASAATGVVHVAEANSPPDIGAPVACMDSRRVVGTSSDPRRKT